MPKQTQLPESAVFLIRNERGELVPRVPEILSYLRAKTERAKEKYQASDWELIWAMNVLTSELIMLAAVKDYLKEKR